MRIAKLISCLVLLPAFPVSAAVVVNYFAASSFNANSTVMNSTLGVTGYSIETFETNSLLPGLSITVSGGVTTTTLTGTLPNLFDQSQCGAVTADSVWDGTHGVINTPTNVLSNCNFPSNVAGLITVSYAPGARSMGIGLGNFQSLSLPSFGITNHELFVNGQDLGVLETLAGASWTAALSRNAYLRVDGTAGTVITSISISNLTAADVLILDHVAVSPVPEPPALLSAAVGVLLLLRSARARRCGKQTA